MNQGPMRIIIDTDPGIDDLHAIYILLEGEKLNLVKIEAFTLTVGNTSLENACKNLVRFLEKANRTDIPIYKGTSNKLISDIHDSVFFGKDGLGDLEYETEPDLSIIKNTPSPIAIKTIIEKNPGKISLVCLGPLTNVALTAKIYENMFENLKQIYIMGGTCRGIGNVTLSAEFNFYFDPESAYIFFQKVACPTLLLPYEPCFDVAVSSDWRFEMLADSTPETKFLRETEKRFFTFKSTHKDKWIISDAYLALIILYPEVAVRKSEYNVTIELHGALTRGQCVIDHAKLKKENVTTVEQLSKDVVIDAILKLYGSK